MRDATLDALRKISRTLHEAGWAEPDSPPPPLTEERFEELRRAAARHLRPDEQEVLQLILAGRPSLAEAAQTLNRDPRELGRLVSDLIADLGTFTTEAASALSGADHRSN